MGAILEINGIETDYVTEISDLENLFIFADKINRLNHEIIVETKLDGHVFSEEYPHQSRDIKLNKISSGFTERPDKGSEISHLGLIFYDIRIKPHIQHRTTR